jgi:vacuolar-type H+-ATPase subunit I/STV1
LNQNFEVNKLIQNLIESNLHKFEVGPKFKTIYENFKTQIENLENILQDPENIIFKEINELKMQVNLDRIKLKSEIDSLADGLIQQLESYETRFKAEYKTEIHLENYNELVKSSRKQLNEYEHCLNLFSTTSEERNEKSSQIERITVDLQPKITELKQNLFSNTSLTYMPMDKLYKQTQSKLESFFGKLIIKVI